MRRRKFFSAILILLIAAFGCAKPQPKMMSAEDAEEKALRVSEVRALYALNNGALASCIDVKTEKSCDSGWVTCREDAWVVKFIAGDRCSVRQDGRLGVVLLIDGKTGEIISRFPEIEYFQDEDFCRDDFDCLCSAVPDRIQCRNFIQAQAKAGPAAPVFQKGRCVKNQCGMP